MEQQPLSFIDTILWILRSCVRHIKLCAAIFFISSIAAIVGTGFIDKEYDSLAIIAPPPAPAGLSLGGLSQQLGDLDMSDIISGGGFSMGSADEGVIRTILASKELHSAIIDSFDLRKVYEIGKDTTKPFYYADVLKEFRANFLVEDSEEDFIQIVYRDKDYHRGVKVINYCLYLLDSLYFHYKKSEVSYSKQFMENQITISSAKLDTIERNLIAYQRKTGVIDPSAQIPSTLKMLADAEAQREIARMQLDLEKSSHGTSTNRYKQLKEQFDIQSESVKRIESGSGLGSVISLKNAPGHVIALQKIKREYVMQSAIDNFLRQSFEQFLLQEAGNIGKIQVLESPWPNNKKAYPPRTAYVIVIIMLSTIMAIMLACTFEFVQSEKIRNSDTYKLIREIGEMLHLLRP